MVRGTTGDATLPRGTVCLTGSQYSALQDSLARALLRVDALETALSEAAGTVEWETTDD